MKYCSNCVAELENKASFCHKCGCQQDNQNINRQNEITFPMAIRVNAWMVLIGTLIIIISMIITSIFSSEIDLTVKEIFFSENENILISIFNILNIILSFVAVWIIYIKKQYLQYIDKAFYIPFALTVVNMVLLVDYSDSEALVINYGVIILMSLPILWLYFSKDVKSFMLTARNQI